MRLITLLILLFFLNSILAAQEYLPNVLLVKIERSALPALNEQLFQQGLTGLAELDSLNQKYRAISVQKLFPYFKHKGTPERPVTLDQWLRIVFESEQDIPALMQSYGALKTVLYADPSVTIPLYKTPNDPSVGSQWHIEQSNDHDVDAYAAWDISTGDSAIIVAVMDTGVRYFHQDLGGANASYNAPENSRGNMWINWAEKYGTAGVDDDGNGKIDDWIGWDFVTGNPQWFNLGDDYDVEDNDPRDFNGHGTHCAGNVGAINNNNLGVSSVAGGWGEDAQARGNGVQIMALRIGWDDLPSGRVGMDFAANAFIYAADNGAKIASCSWGSSNVGGLEDAVNYFLYNTTVNLGPANRVRLIFKAAGNDNDTATDYLNGRDDVISVAATDENDQKASFSNYGTWVDISAPGNNIYTTYHDANSPETDVYASVSGTSMATPIAASVAALVWSHNPALTAPEVEQMLFDSADDLDALNPSYAGLLGAGRVNAAAAVQLSDQSLPVTLTSFEAQWTGENVQLSWQTASEIDNLGFNIYRSEHPDSAFFLLASFKDHSQLKGLGNSASGKSYFFTDTSPLQGGRTYFYLLEDVAFNGKSQKHGPASVSVPSAVLPERITLLPAFPNPFNQQTAIRLYVPDQLSSGAFTLSIFNGQGQKVRLLASGKLNAGWQRFIWNGRDENGQAVSSGVYFCVIHSKDFKQARKLILIK
ncbi:S8 family serine peptidase [Caldithrix abyssi]